MKRSLTALCMICLFASGAMAADKTAQSAVVLSAGQSTIETLKKLIDNQKPVTLVLRSGKEYQGFVKEVSNGNVLLTRLAQRDFSDAVVKTDEIVAIELRVRGN